jgi:hypothetical protein
MAECTYPRCRHYKQTYHCVGVETDEEYITRLRRTHYFLPFVSMLLAPEGPLCPICANVFRATLETPGAVRTLPPDGFIPCARCRWKWLKLAIDAVSLPTAMPQKEMR